MKAALLYGPRDIRVEKVEDPEPEEGWAIVKSMIAGICGTDKAFYRGSYPLMVKPLIPGHEVSGVVVEGPPELVGKRVVSEINFSCMKCRICRAGLYTHCPNRRTLGIDYPGGMAEYFKAPVWALHTHSLPHETAFAAEPLAAVLNAFYQYPPREGWSIAIIGTGFISLLSAMVLKYRGFNPVIVAREGSVKGERLSRMEFNVVTFNEALEFGRRDTWSGLGFDMIVEATGSNEGLRQAIALARPRGAIHAKSTPGGDAELPLTLAVVKEVRIIGTRCGSFREFQEALRLLERGVITPIIDRIYDIDDVKEAFNHSLSRETFRIAIKP